MRHRFSTLTLLLLITFISLTGCVNQKNIPLKADFWKQRKQKIVVVNNKKIRPALYHQGQEGLLDMAINNVVTDKFQRHLQSSTMDWYSALRSDFARILKKHGMNAVIGKDINVADLPNYKNKGDKTKNYAHKDYTTLSMPMPGDKLLVIQVNQFGALRSYYGFIPLGPPKALVTLQGRLVNTHSNELLWRYTTQIVMSTEAPWNQPPHYPNFDKTLKKALSMASREMLNDFKVNV